MHTQRTVLAKHTLVTDTLLYIRILDHINNSSDANPMIGRPR